MQGIDKQYKTYTNINTSTLIDTYNSSSFHTTLTPPVGNVESGLGFYKKDQTVKMQKA